MYTYIGNALYQLRTSELMSYIHHCMKKYSHIFNSYCQNI